jgi:hypothetical protein
MSRRPLDLINGAADKAVRLPRAMVEREACDNKENKPEIPCTIDGTTRVRNVGGDQMHLFLGHRCHDITRTCPRACLIPPLAVHAPSSIPMPI